MSLNPSRTPGPHARASIISLRHAGQRPSGPRTGAFARPAAKSVASGKPVLVAVWCCSVGATWTVEIYQHRPGATLGTLVDWISSGVPTSQPVPDQTMARELLAGRGLYLYPDPAIGPCTPSRHGIGYVCEDAEVIALAHRVRDAAAAAGVHPVLLAAQQPAAGSRIPAGSAKTQDKPSPRP